MSTAPHSGRQSVRGSHRHILRSSTAAWLALSLSTGLASNATADTWTGLTSTDWDTGTNWDGNTPPTTTSDVTIDSGALGNQPRIQPSLDVRYIGDLVVNSGTLTLESGLTVDSLAGNGGTIALLHGMGLTDLTFGNDNSNTTYSGNITTGSTANGIIKIGYGSTTLYGTINGTGRVEVINGSLTLTGANTYSGATGVDATLYVTAAGTLGSGQVNVSLGTLVTDGGALSSNVMSNYGTFRVTGGSETVSSYIGTGTLDLSEGTAVNQSLTVAGNFVGGGTLEFDANLSGPGALADRLIVHGNTSGVTTIDVTDIGISPGAYNPDGIALVQVSGTTSANNFVLKNGPISKGLFIYDLQLDGGTHELVSSLNAPLASGPAVVVSAAETIWAASTDTWDARQQELRDWATGRTVVTAVADPPSRENMPRTVWLSASGNWNDREAQGTELGFSQNIYGLTAGADFGSELDSGSAVLFGLQAGFVTSDLDIEDGLGSGAQLEGFTGGAYATLLGNGFFLQTLANVALLDTDLAVGGFAAATDTAVWGLRADAGYRLEFGTGLFLEPMVSAAVANSDLDNFVLAGVTFNNASNDMIWLGGGARLGYAGNGVDAALTARLWNDVSGDNSLGLAPLGPALTVSDSGMFDAVFGEVGGKLGIEIASNASLFGQGQLRFDGTATAVSANAGMTFRW